MKNHRILIAGIFMLMTAMVLPNPAIATIIGSAHDLSIFGGVVYSSNEDEVCVFCHTPHGGIVTDPAGTGTTLPLWNRNLNYGAAFTMYTSDTFDGTYIGSKPTGQSLMCLSCHDGVSTFQSVINYSGAAILMDPASIEKFSDLVYSPSKNPNIGRDLSNDHPVSFVYNNALVDADTITRGGGADQLTKPETVSVAPLKLYGGRLECTTCHDPHENDIADQKPFLRMSNAGSTMCTTCHIK